MAGSLDRHVVLVGMMGAGKTAVGTALARLLGVPFRDTDDAIERAAAMTIPEIFARDGEAFFRQKENQVLVRLLGEKPGVLSTGGGLFLSPENRDAISRAGVSVWLKADLDLLWSRVRQRSHRPLLRTADPRGTLERLLGERAPVYALADVVVTSEAGLAVEAMAARVRDAVAAHVVAAHASAANDPARKETP